MVVALVSPSINNGEPSPDDSGFSCGKLPVRIAALPLWNVRRMFRNVTAALTTTHSRCPWTPSYHTFILLRTHTDCSHFLLPCLSDANHQSARWHWRLPPSAASLFGAVLLPVLLMCAVCYPQLPLPHSTIIPRLWGCEAVTPSFPLKRHVTSKTLNEWCSAKAVWKNSLSVSWLTFRIGEGDHVERMCNSLWFEAGLFLFKFSFSLPHTHTHNLARIMHR